MTTITGISTAGIHAPLENFETTTTTATIPVSTVPRQLIDAPTFQRGSRSRKWWTTIPAWLNVKPVNTPKAYNGISAVTLPSKATIRTPAAAARKMIPLENTSLSPRLAI